MSDTSPLSQSPAQYRSQGPGQQQYEYHAGQGYPQSNYPVLPSSQPPNQLFGPAAHHRYPWSQQASPHHHNAIHRHSFSEGRRSEPESQQCMPFRASVSSQQYACPPQIVPHGQRQRLELPTKHELPLPTMAHTTQQTNAIGRSRSHGLGSAFGDSSDLTGQTAPMGMKPRVTATLWEDERSMCYQVEAKGICVARRDDNHMINGTKLLNVAGMTRGKRDGILKSEKTRHVVKIGPMHLKGVWIPFERALDFANKEKITDLLYPLFVHNIGQLLCHSDTGPPTSRFRNSDNSLHIDARYPFHHSTVTPSASLPNTPAPPAASAFPPARQEFNPTYGHSYNASSAFVLNTVASQRPGLERAHTFPTPPTSASGGVPTFNADHPPYSWSTNLNTQDNSANRPENHSHQIAHSTPATPATTPPRSTGSTDESFETQPLQHVGPTTPVSRHNGPFPSLVDDESISPQTLRTANVPAFGLEVNANNPSPEQLKDCNLPASEGRFHNLGSRDATSSYPHSANVSIANPETEHNLSSPAAGMGLSQPSSCNEDLTWSNGLGITNDLANARYHVPSAARSTLPGGPTINASYDMSGRYPASAIDDSGRSSFKRRRNEDSDDDAITAKYRRLSPSHACDSSQNFDEQQYKQPRCLLSQPSSVR